MLHFDDDPSQLGGKDEKTLIYSYICIRGGSGVVKRDGEKRDRKKN